MNKKIVYGFIGIILLVVVVIVIVRVWGSSVDTPSIDVPSPSSGTQPGLLDDDGNLLNVDTDTVQELVKSLSRASAYNIGYELTTFYAGGEAKAAINVWQNGGRFLISRTGNNRNKNILISDGQIHIWYAGSGPVFTADLEDYDFSTLDKYAGLITYEELLDIPAEDIIDAGYTDRQGTGCIYAEYESSNNYVNQNYTNRLYISAESGLLIEAEVLEGGEQIYNLKAHIINMSAPDDGIFQPPS